MRKTHNEIKKNLPPQIENIYLEYKNLLNTFIVKKISIY